MSLPATNAKLEVKTDLSRTTQAPVGPVAPKQISQ